MLTYLALPLLFLAVILQTSVLPYFPLLDAVPLLPVLLALAWGLLRGWREGILWAFVAGLGLDLFSIGPLGVSALALIVAVWGVAAIQDNLPTSRVFLPPILSALGTSIYLLLSIFLLRLSGYPIGLSVWGQLINLVVLHTLLILPVYWSLYVLLRRIEATRLTLPQ